MFSIPVIFYTFPLFVNCLLSYKVDLKDRATFIALMSIPGFFVSVSLHLIYLYHSVQGVK
jgi:hypothetical protein